MWLFFFAKEDPNKVRPHESLPQEVTISHNNDDSPFSQRNLAQARARMYQQNNGAANRGRGLGGGSGGIPLRGGAKKPRFTPASGASGTASAAASMAGTKTTGLDDMNVETVGSGDSGTSGYADASSSYADV